MSEVAVMLARYREVRQRLMFPPNAVPDTGIDLKRPKGITAPTEGPPQILALAAPATPRTQPTTIPLEAAPMSDPPLRGALTFSSTIEVTAQQFGLTTQHIKNKCRKRKFVIPRHIAIYLGRKQGRKISWMGKFLDMDHTSILYAQNKIRAMMQADQNFASVVNAIEQKLECLHSSALPANHKLIMESGAE